MKDPLNYSDEELDAMSIKRVLELRKTLKNDIQKTMDRIAHLTHRIDLREQLLKPQTQN